MLAIKVTNRQGGTAGLAARLVVQKRNQPKSVVVTDATWKSSLSALPFWHRVSYADRRWKAAKSIGTFAEFQARLSRQSQAKQATAKNVRGGNGTATRSRALTRLPAAGEHLEAPLQFSVKQIAGHKDVGSVVSMTFNESGQILAAREDGKLILIEDTDGDGEYDSVRDHCHFRRDTKPAQRSQCAGH